MKKSLVFILLAAVIAVGVLYFYKKPASDQSGIEMNGTGSIENVTFKYPETLDTPYINISHPNWPPKVEVQIAQFMCAETLDAINGRDYCIGQEGSAAAGTYYVSYVYNTMKGDRMVSVSFTLGYPNCENYDEPQKSECQSGQDEFDVDALADGIVDSVKW